MASQRDAIIAACISALNAGTPPTTAVRFPVLPVTPNTVPLIGVTPESEDVQFVGHRANNGAFRWLTVVVSCWAKNGSSSDNALDAMVTWVVQKLIPVNALGDIDETVGGTAHAIEEVGTQWFAEIQDHVYQRADVRFRIGYQTKRTDPTTKVG